MKPAILFELHHLGDAVLSLPFVREAARIYELHVVCRPPSRVIFEKWLPPSQIHAWEPWWEPQRQSRGSSLAALPALLKTLRSLQAELALTVWADSRVHTLMRATGAPVRLGFAVNERNFYAHELPWRHRRMRLGQMLGLLAPLTRRLERADYQQAHLEDWRQLTLAAGCPWNVQTPWFAAGPDPEILKLRAPGQPLWVIHPGGRLPTKRWPVERFEELLREHLAGVPVAVIRPPDSTCPALHSALHRIVDTPDFESLAATLAAADFILCNDSLVSHLGAALGKPVFTIFGSGNPRWFAPFGSEARVIATDACPFRPCIDRCVQPSIVCLESLSVARVAAAIKL